MKSKKIVFIIVILIITLIFVYRYYTSNYTNEGIINNIIDRDGYSLTLESEQIPLEIFIKPEWIAFNQDERKELKVKVLKLYNTDIWLDNVWNRGNDIYFSFTTSFNMNYKAGELMYNGFFNTNGTFTTPSGEVRLYDKNLNEFTVGQTGTGPEAAFSFGIQPEEQKLISEGFYVKYNGYNLYVYSKK
ncbi:hypothetical protein AMS62_19865 [Bacillus sp. FJAT-18019]|nr:hypothetical protein AMS62_19865 [Bacillus sp. FJAT-18019]